MNISKCSQNPSFGQLVPAKPLIKSALGNPSYEEAKFLNQSLGVQYSGHIGFHKRALKIAETACTKNETFNNIISGLKKLSGTQREEEINRIVKTHGEVFDINL